LILNPVAAVLTVLVSDDDESVKAGKDKDVAGNTAVITPESAEWVTEVAPATVKKLAVTPVNVYPDVGVRVIVAV
jgi:hypothetical protein